MPISFIGLYMQNELTVTYNKKLQIDLKVQF